MQTPKDELTQRLVDLVERISAQMRPESDEEWTDLELTMPQFRAICLLGQGPERMGNIAGHLSTSMSSATSMIDRLVDKGLVERAPDASERRWSARPVRKLKPYDSWQPRWAAELRISMASTTV